MIAVKLSSKFSLTPRAALDQPLCAAVSGIQVLLRQLVRCSGQLNNELFRKQLLIRLERQSEDLQMLAQGKLVFESTETWRCVYEHPRQRIMRAHESKWADRIDLFEAADDSTLWTVEWQPKGAGFQAYTQWLGYQIRGKTHLYADVILPVIVHFQERTTTRHRTLSRRNRRRRQ